MPLAIVTGGSRGIGLAIARELAARGFDLALAARSRTELEQARETILRDFPVRCVVQPTDVADAVQAQALVDRAQKDLGQIWAVINNAGITGAIGELSDCDLLEWRRAIEVNLLGTMHMTRAVIPYLRRGGGGRIVNVAGGGVGGPAAVTRLSAYVTSKAAVVQFTECIAREVAADNIHVNVISPGAVVTEMTAGIVAAGPDKAGRELYERTLRQRESGGEPPQLAARLVAWLLSPPNRLTGKMLSAKWDDVSRIDAETANQTSLYTLRRVDGSLVQEVPPK
jgi:NAD(P)-dependent dehydrogenase (short-subunit alcohol dehydrogenase family)